MDREGTSLDFAPEGEEMLAGAWTGEETLVADVRQPDAVGSAVERVVAELGALDIVVNNAAGNFLCPSADLSPNGFGTVLDIDTKGTWNVSRSAYHAWLKEHGGQILNISATLHYGGTPLQIHVAAAKAKATRIPVLSSRENSTSSIASTTSNSPGNHG